jgi:hypothetical protein
MTEKYNEIKRKTISVFEILSILKIKLDVHYISDVNLLLVHIDIKYTSMETLPKRIDAQILWYIRLSKRSMIASLSFFPTFCITQDKNYWMCEQTNNQRSPGIASLTFLNGRIEQRHLAHVEPRRFDSVSWLHRGF